MGNPHTGLVLQPRYIARMLIARDTLLDVAGARFSSDDPTAQAKPSEQGRLSLAVLAEGFVATHPLPQTGSVTIGRGSDADIKIDHEAVSRKHLKLTLGDELTIEDLGSSNGTRLRDQPLAANQRAAVAPGDVIELGTVMLVIQRHAVATQGRRVWSHDAFEARLDEECERAARHGGTFQIVRLHVAGIESATLQDVVLARVRPEDLVAWYGPSDIEILILDARDDIAAKLVAKLKTMLTSASTVKAAIATFPRDGRSADDLLGRAAEQLASASTTPSIVLASPAMQAIHRMLERVATGTINVLVLGETGVGKEIVAQRLHELSPRASGPLLKLNCAALSESLLESELFGHEKGAFTGAVATKPGLLETARGGTVFLDEIGDLPLPLQAKLLRVIEDRKVMRVGGLEGRPIDVRFVAATHRDLEAAITAQTFRQDLYYRLNGFTLVIPPLRERVDEIVPLARTFAEHSARALRLTTPRFEEAALAMLRAYQWPGNVRELRNVIERAVLLAGPDAIGPEHLPLEKLHGSTADGESSSLRAGVMERERALIVDALERAKGNQTEAARILGISRRTLVSRLTEYGLPRPRKGGGRG